MNLTHFNASQRVCLKPAVIQKAFNSKFVYT